MREQRHQPTKGSQINLKQQQPSVKVTTFIKRQRQSHPRESTAFIKYYEIKNN